MSVKELRELFSFKTAEGSRSGGHAGKVGDVALTNSGSSTTPTSNEGNKEETNEGIKNGKGKYVWEDGSVYTGQWNNGNMEATPEKLFPYGLAPASI